MWECGNMKMRKWGNEKMRKREKMKAFGLLTVGAMVAWNVSAAEKKADFGAAEREARTLVENQAKAEKAARAQKEKAFIFGLREGGSTFGLGQTPLKIKEDPAIDAAVMKEAYAKLRAALPAELTEKDAVRLEQAELALEERGGNRASRGKALAKLMARAKNPDAVAAVMGLFRRRRAYVEMLAFADQVLDANKDNAKLTAVGLGWKWFAAAKLEDKPLKDAVRARVDALPLTAENVRGTYWTLLGEGSLDPADFARFEANLDNPVLRGMRGEYYRHLLGGACGRLDYRGILKYLPLVEKYRDAKMANTMAADAFQRLRCWADADRCAEKAYSLKPTDDDRLRLVRTRLALGKRAEAAAMAGEIAASEKAKPQLRFTARLLGVIASAATPADVTTGILALEADSGAKDGNEFATWVFAAVNKAFEPLMTSDQAKWLLAAREAELALLHEEERVVHTVKYCPSAPRTAAGAEAAGLFDNGWFSPYRTETRFAPIQTYGWNRRDIVMKNLKCGPKPELSGVTGEGRSSEIIVVYDEAGVHVYTRFRDPSAAKFRLGEASGAGYEFSVWTGKGGWNQVFTTTDAVKDLNEVQWDSLDYGHRPTFGSIVTDSTTTDEAFLFHTFIPWTHAYDRIPKDGDVWYTVMCAGVPAGTYVLGGGTVHELGRGMRLKFAMDADESRIVRRALVRRAAGDFLRFRAPWENIDMWEDNILGDPAFYAAVVKGWRDEREQAARGLVRRPDAEVTDAEYEALGAKYLRDWLDPRLVLGDLRVAWLAGKFFKSL